MVDAARLKTSFAHVAESGDEVPLFFYSYLFLRHPGTRSMFPPGMAAQRDRLVGALARIVADVDQLDTLVPFVEQLGRDHRKFQVAPEHFPAVGEALLATLRHFLGDGWTDDLAADWAAAYGIVSDVMIKAAEEADGQAPASWQARIVEHDRRRPDVAVIRLIPDQPVPYLPGQSVSVQTPHRARLWRFYSPANAPREDGGIELHVRAIDGGWVSSALVAAAAVGDGLELGSPVGELHLDPGSDADVLLLAGGTGLAPLLAMAEQALHTGPRRRVHLFHEGGTEADLYDRVRLERLAAAYPDLRVTLTARRGPVRHAIPGTGADAAVRQGRWGGHDVYVCGSDEMVTFTTDTLLRNGIDPARLRTETFGYRRTAEVVATMTGGEAR
jgi:ferredoxin-NADP reductase/hemoglobin-like flavoprotein